MKEKLIGILLITLSYPTYCQVQKWENWQSNFTITDGNAISTPTSRNVGLNLWPDRGFGQELHYRNNTWGTALYTRSSYEAIWLGNYNFDETQQQNFNPWMTLINGRVGIGTTVPGEKLSVNGTILAKKIKVLAASAEWPDYVFSPYYKLRPLAELDNYVKLRKHLPDVPSAKDIEKNNLDIGATQAILLRKIEELTLYVIEQDKKIRQLEKHSLRKYLR